MVQWITVAIAILGFVYNGYKDISNGNIPSPLTTQNQTVMYWQVAFAPNTGKMYHLQKDGKWHDGPPQIREYPNQNQETLGVGNWTQRASGSPYEQSAKTIANTIRRY